MKGLLLCLATRKGLEVLEEILPFRGERPVYVCGTSEPDVSESFEVPIARLAGEARLPRVSWKDFRQDPVAFLSRLGVGAILCVGWRYLVPEAPLAHLGGEVIVAHDALLPRLRGFAPLPTAIITGETQTGVTFLRAGRGVDDGPILWQKAVDIGPTDTIEDLIAKVTPLYREGARLYVKGELGPGTPQQEALATYSLWRDVLDYRLDWSESAARIERTVRALGSPYLGAQTTLDGEAVVLHRAALAPDLAFAIRQPGKIWNLDPQGRPTVVCGSGMLHVLEASSRGQSIFPLKKLRQRFV